MLQFEDPTMLSSFRAALDASRNTVALCGPSRYPALLSLYLMLCLKALVYHPLLVFLPSEAQAVYGGASSLLLSQLYAHLSYSSEFDAMSLATPEAFRANPSRSWQFYHMRRIKALQAIPNAAHLALARASRTRNITIVTQNVDGLGRTARTEAEVGNSDLEMHG